MAAKDSAPKCSTEMDSGLRIVAAAAAAAAAGPRNVRSLVPAMEAIESDWVPSSIPVARSEINELNVRTARDRSFTTYGWSSFTNMLKTFTN